MKKITLLFVLLLTFWSWHANAQFGCDTAIPITDGYTASGLTTPGTGGLEDWNTNPTGTSINASYWDDDVYMFMYTAGATTEEISMTIFSRNSWNGIGIFDNCAVDTFSDELDAEGTTGTNSTKTVSAIIPAGSTVYIAVGQWGTPNGLDFDVTDFTVNLITCPEPSNLSASNVNTTSADFSWTAGSNETAWNIEIVEAGQTPTGNGIAINDNFYGATGLLSGTEYEFYVQADCSGGDLSTWAGPFSFATPCDAISAPYSENFSGTIIPDCWTESGDNPWDFSTNADYAAANVEDHSLGGGTNYAWLDGSDNGDGEVSSLTSPFIDVSNLIDPALRFFVFSNNTDSAAINILTVEIFDGASWNTVQTINTLLGNSWNEFIVDLSNYTITGHVQIKFTITGNSNGGEAYHHDILIDDVEFMELPSCFNPSSLAVDNITSSSADLSWTAGDTESLWNIEVVSAGATPTGTGVSTADNPYTASGLTANTNYDFYVQADCGSGDLSEWLGPISFTTECEDFTLPVCENFDSTDTGTSSNPTVPSCWSFIDSGSGYGYVSSTGANSFYIYNSGDSTGDYILASPSITGVTAGGNRIVFDVDGSTGQELLVGTMSDPTDATTFIAIQTIVLASNDYENYIVDIPAGTDSYIAFKHGQTGTYDSYYIDNVCIEETPSCPNPIALNTGVLTATTAELIWTAGGTESLWNIEIVSAGSTPTGTATATGISTPYTATNLTASTDYEFYVQADCGDEESIWAGPFAFTTECAAYVPDYSEDFLAFLPMCWEQATSGNPATGPTGFGSSSWIHDDYLNTGTTDNSARINLYAASKEDWLISPEFDLSAADYELEMEVGLTDYANSNAPEGNGMGTDDQVLLLVTTDAGATWQNLVTYDASNYPNELGETETVDISAYTGTVQFAFWGTEGTVDDPEDYDFFINSFSVTEVVDTEPSFTCNYSLMMYDSWGDGWNGATIDVLVNGVVVLDDETFTTENDGDFFELPFGVNDGDDVTVVWNGGGSFDDETSYEILDADGNVVGSGAESDITTGTITALCPTCPAPMNVEITNVTSSGATLSWDAVSNAVDYSYVVVFDGVGPDGTPVDADITTNTSVDLSNLTPATNYDVYVMADCGAGDESSWAGPVDLETECATFTAPFVETFDDTGMPNCWTQSGATAWTFNGDPDYAAEDVADHTVGGGTSFAFMDGSNNIAGEVSSLTSPFVDISTLTDPALRFYIFSNNTNDAAINIIDVEVYDGATWNTVQTINSLLGSSWTEFVVDLSTFTITGDVQVKFTVTGSATGTPFYNDILIDDVEFLEMPTCLNPSGLTVVTATETTATVSWTPSGDETEWDVIYGPAGFNPTNSGTTVTDNDGTPGITLSSLTADTDYDFYVMAVCDVDDTSSWVGPGSFYTGYCVSEPSNVDGNGLASAQVGSDSFTSAGDAVTYEDFTGTIVELQQGLEANVELVYDHTYAYYTHVWVDFNDNMVFDATELVFSGQSNNASPNVVDASFQMPVDAPMGTHRMRIVGTWSQQTPPNPCYNGSWGVTSDFTIDITEAPFCLPPSNIQVSNLLSTSATISWDAAANAVGYDWIIVYQGAGSDATPVDGSNTSNTSVDVINLAASTDYDVYVMSDCGTEDSMYSQPFSFTTPCDLPTLPFFEGFENNFTHDTSVDGCWSQQSISGTQEWTANNTYTTYNRTPRTGSWNAFLRYGNEDWMFTPLPLVAGETYRLRFYARQDGGTAANANVAASIGAAGTAADMTEVIIPETQIVNGDYQMVEGLYTAATSGVYYLGIKGEINFSPWYISVDDITFEVAPDCIDPTALAASNITSTTAELGWTANNSETSWNIEVVTAGTTPTGVGTSTTNNPYIATGLLPNTEYEFYVQADCGSGELSPWSGPYSFTTTCEPATIPFFEGFETGYVHDTEVDGCWSQESVTGIQVWTANNTYTTFNRTPRTGSWNAFLRYGNEDWLFRPLQLQAGETYRVRFYARQDGAVATNSNVSASIGTSESIIGMTDVVVAETDIVNGDYQMMQGYYTPATTGVYYLGIKGEINFSPWYISIDDISVELAPSCIDPLALTATNITSTTADLGWTGNDETAWNVEVVTAGTTPTGVGTSTTNNPYAATGLLPNTEYEFYVQADCGNGDLSPWSGPYSFTTTCEPATIPFFEGFEDDFVHNTEVNGCWSQESTSGTSVWTANNTFTTYNRSPRTGNWNAYLQYGNEDWLFRPIELVAGETYMLEFFARQDGDVEANANVAASIGSSGTVVGMTDVIVPETPIVNGDYQQMVGFYTAPTTGVYYLGIKGEMNFSPWYISIDDISLEIAPACLPPGNVQVLETYAGGADISWDAVGNAINGYEWVVVAVDGDPTVPGEIIASGTTMDEFDTITGLESGVDYEVYVSANCGDVDGESSFSQSASFTTLCQAPTGLSIEVVGYEEVQFSWDPLPQSLGYEYIIVLAGAEPIEENYVGVGTIGSGDQSSIIVEYLEMGTEYDLYLRIICDTNFYGEWDSINFTTLSVGKNTIEGFTYYPNPVKDMLTLESINNIESVEVYNMLGQQVLVENPNGLNSTIDMSRLQAGAYVVRVKVGAQIGTYRIIKE